MSHHLAQINVAQAKAPLDSPLMQDFAAQLDAVNALAAASPGFVWAYTDAEGDETQKLVYPDPLTLVNMSIWTDVDALKTYVYRGQHGTAFKRRQDWFESTAGPNYALWWIPAGTKPSVAEGKRRLDLLAAHGPTADAFTFRELFPAPVA